MNTIKIYKETKELENYAKLLSASKWYGYEEILRMLQLSHIKGFKLATSLLKENTL